jgi:hypothetical protein
MRPAITSEKITDTLTISECYPCGEHKHGYWLYDNIRGMNLAMGAKTKEDAYIKAITYYQKRLADVESKYKELDSKVSSFLTQFSIEDE